MARQLVSSKQAKDEAEAMKLAKKHIKSTLDVGHMNMWRQHLQRKEGESPEAFDKRYKEWYTGQLKDLAKRDVLGHIHLTDNFGFHDEHLTPGMGNTPIKEAMKVFAEAGITDMIVEAGSFNPTTALQDTMAYFGSSVGPSHRPFNQMHQRHFGYAAPSNYIVGAYAPSNEWRLWSEVPLE
ncbi:MAG: sugar phosphate isomerase/epimerase [Nitrosarchaeum sp.]|nr:sugar phosphate isomerase/epimerase [Nitrosarchaeum sp.]